MTGLAGMLEAALFGEPPLMRPVSRVYFDTSGAMRYLVHSRRGHQPARELWDLADQVVSAGVTYVEVRAALAVGRRNLYWGEPGFARLKQTWQEA